MALKEPYRESEWADISPLLKYISGASPEGPEGAVSGEYYLFTKFCMLYWTMSVFRQFYTVII